MNTNHPAAPTSRPILWDGKGWSPVTGHSAFSVQTVKSFYQTVVAGTSSLTDLGIQSGEQCLFGELWHDQLQDFQERLKVDSSDITEQRERLTFKLCLSFYGPVFDGWAYNLDSNSVERNLTEALRCLTGDAKLKLFAAGRTDKGVSSCAQVVSFYTWKPITIQDIINTISAAHIEELRVCATWRRYVYLLPLKKETSASGPHSEDDLRMELDVEKIQSLLDPLLGKKLDFYPFARDTPAGKNCECLLYSCRAFIVSLLMRSSSESNSMPAEDPAPYLPCLCIEILADRFLRRMVRVLVSTVVRESIPEAARYDSKDNEALLKIIESRDRLLTAPPAPAEGLCLAGVGYDDYND